MSVYAAILYPYQCMWRLTYYRVNCFPVVVALSTEDPHIVGYVSDTITLPCNHTVAKADLEAVVWRKDTETIVGEYDIGDDPSVSFYDSMEGRASIKVFPPTLLFSNASHKDAGVYQCEVFPLKDDPIVFRYILRVNGREFICIGTHVLLSRAHFEGIVCILFM